MKLDERQANPKILALRKYYIDTLLTLQKHYTQVAGRVVYELYIMHYHAFKQPCRK